MKKRKDGEAIAQIMFGVKRNEPCNSKSVFICTICGRKIWYDTIRKYTKRLFMNINRW